MSGPRRRIGTARAAGTRTSSAARRRGGGIGQVLPISVVVPTRNVASWVESCLAAVRANRPAEIIVVDGASTDGTIALAAPYADVIVDDGGEGVSAARRMGFELTTQPWVAFVDADVILEPDSLGRLLQEAEDGHLDGVQSGLRSIGAGDYWSEALARHHNRGRSRRWFGVCATILRREVMAEHPFDPAFRSGEDVDLRIRLLAAGRRVTVSKTVDVAHRFAPGFAFAREQWFADGAGLGRVVRKHGWSALPLAILPFGASAIGLARVLVGEVLDVPYWIALALGNFLGLCTGLLDPNVPIGPARRRPARVLVETRGARGVPLDVEPESVDETAPVARPTLVRDEPVALNARDANGAGEAIGGTRETGSRRSNGARPSGRGPAGLAQLNGVVSDVAVRRAGDREIVAEARSSRQAGEVRVAAVLGLLALGGVAIAIVSAAAQSGVAPGLGTLIATSAVPPFLMALVVALLVVAEIAGSTSHPILRRDADRFMPALLIAAVVVLVVSGVRLAYIVGLLA